MQSEIFQTICRMGIFMVCARSVLHFRAKASYEKYLKMLVGMMLLVQLFLPIGRLFLGGSAEVFEKRVKEFEKTLDFGLQQALENAAQSEKKLEEFTLREVQERVAEQARQEKQEEEEESRITVFPVEQIHISLEEEKKQNGRDETEMVFQRK